MKVYRCVCFKFYLFSGININSCCSLYFITNIPTLFIFSCQSPPKLKWYKIYWWVRLKYFLFGILWVLHTQITSFDPIGLSSPQSSSMKRRPKKNFKASNVLKSAGGGLSSCFVMKERCLEFYILHCLFLVEKKEKNIFTKIARR